MREVKFRAWNKISKVMGYVHSIDFAEEEVKVRVDNLNITQETGLSFDFRYWNFDVIELMQLTGLKDKNGKEIYEGDVLKCIDLGAPDFTVTGVIEWDEDLVAYSFKYMDFRLTEYDELEVLGSIYENPELIKETTKYLVELNETLPLFTGNSELSGAYKDVKKQYKWIKEIKKSIEQEGGK